MDVSDCCDDDYCNLMGVGDYYEDDYCNLRDDYDDCNLKDENNYDDEDDLNNYYALSDYYDEVLELKDLDNELYDYDD